MLHLIQFCVSVSVCVLSCFHTEISVLMDDFLTRLHLLRWVGLHD